MMLYLSLFSPSGLPPRRRCPSFFFLAPRCDVLEVGAHLPLQPPLIWLLLGFSLRVPVYDFLGARVLFSSV